MYTLSALLALYAENPLYNSGFPAQRSRNAEVWRFLCCHSNMTILLSYVHITMWWCQWVIYKETTGFPTCLPFQWYEHKQNLHQSTKMKHECAHNSCNTPYKTYRWVKSKKDVTSVYWQQSYVFLALPHRYETWFPDNCLIHSLSLFWKNKANLRDVIAATGPVILLKLDSNRWFFSPCDLEIWWMTSKIIGHLSYITSSFVHHLKPLGEFKLELLSGNAQNQQYFVLSDLEIRWMTLKNNRAPLLCYIKLCVSFQSHRWIQTKVTVQKRPIRVKISNFLSHMTLKFDGWPWKTIGHLFYATSSLCIIS